MIPEIVYTILEKAKTHSDPEYCISGAIEILKQMDKNEIEEAGIINNHDA